MIDLAVVFFLAQSLKDFSRCFFVLITNLVARVLFFLI